MFFKDEETKISYDDIIQLDGAFYAYSEVYEKTPFFNQSRIEISNKQNNKFKEYSDDDIGDYVCSIKSTMKNLNLNEKKELWSCYWIEYINAFEKISNILPDSVVTAYIGRQAIEIGFKYLMICMGKKHEKTHDLGKLSKKFFKEIKKQEPYLQYIEAFCVNYCKDIEGGNPEYFRFPEYKSDTCFGGIKLDIPWLSYNMKLIILKLLHYHEVEIKGSLSNGVVVEF